MTVLIIAGILVLIFVVVQLKNKSKDQQRKAAGLDPDADDDNSGNWWSVVKKYRATLTLIGIVLIPSILFGIRQLMSLCSSEKTGPEPLGFVGPFRWWTYSSLLPDSLQAAAAIFLILIQALGVVVALVAFKSGTEMKDKSGKFKPPMSVSLAIALIFFPAFLELLATLDGFTEIYALVLSANPALWILVSVVFSTLLIFGAWGLRTLGLDGKGNLIIAIAIGLVLLANVKILYRYTNPIPLTAEDLWVGTPIENCKAKADNKFESDLNTCVPGPGAIIAKDGYGVDEQTVHIAGWTKFNPDNRLHKLIRACAMVDDGGELNATVSREEWCWIEREGYQKVYNEAYPVTVPEQKKGETNAKYQKRVDEYQSGQRLFCSTEEPITPCGPTPTLRELVGAKAEVVGKAASKATTIDRMQCETKVVQKGSPTPGGEWASIKFNIGALKPGDKFRFGICGFPLYKDGTRPDRRKQWVKLWYTNPQAMRTTPLHPFDQAPMKSAGVQVFQVPLSASDWVGGEYVYAQIGVADLVVYGPVDSCSVADLAEACGNGTDLFLRHVHEVEDPVGSVTPLEEGAPEPTGAVPDMREFE